MLRITVSESAAGARSYFGGGGADSEYYADGMGGGRWHGLGAARLGLLGDVDAVAFARLCENLHPHGEGQLTPRQKTHRRVGYDVNFHCPKSVSLLHALSGDTRISEVFLHAVESTMRRIEAEAATRVRMGGQQLDRMTGNLVWATFMHETSRPVNGIPDPHLHAHCFTFNVTFDETEARWKALQFGDVKRDARYFEACFHAELAVGLRRLGYGIRHTKGAWEIAGIPRDLIERFSQRSHVIEREAAKRGINDAERKASLGAETRESKRSARPPNGVRSVWHARLTDDDWRALRDAHKYGDQTRLLEPRDAVTCALGSLLERSSVVRERTLAAEALRFGLGNNRPEEVLEAIALEPLVRRGCGRESAVTTYVSVREEERFVAMVRTGRGQYPSFMQGSELIMGDDASPRLSLAQRAAARHVLGSHDFVTLVRGAAGTGKTTMMRETTESLQAAGHCVSVFAPTAEAARGVLRREGFAGAETVAKLLTSVAMQDAVRGHILWIDEAGLLGIGDASRVLTLARSLGCRVILCGDTRQHAAVSRGDAMRLCETKAGCPVAELSEIRRQTGVYRDAVLDISEGRVAEGFRRLDSIGALVEASGNERHQMVAREYVQTRLARRSVLVVSPTHGEGRAITDAIREELFRSGQLHDEREFTRLTPLTLTATERSRPMSYDESLIVRFHRPCAGFRLGVAYRVAKVGLDEVLVRSDAGLVRPLPLSHAHSFEAFAQDTVAVAIGDELRVTRGMRTKDRKHRLENGALVTVRAFTEDGDIVLTNGWVVGRDAGHFTHGYCATSYAAQGKTVDRVIISQGDESFAASSREQFYVSVSRARERAIVFTNDKESLLRVVRESGSRQSALALVEMERHPARARCRPRTPVRHRDHSIQV
jgi:conjugative relaxase-like TrwC/TraI family protein